MADDAFVRDGIRAVLASDPTFRIVGEATNLAEARLRGERTKATLFVIDVTGLKVGAIDIVRQMGLYDGAMSAAVVLLAAEYSRADLDALRLGLCAVVRSRTSATELAAIIRLASAGYVPVERSLVRRLVAGMGKTQASGNSVTHRLTRREQEVFDLVVQGMSNKEIADKLTIASSTAKSYVQSEHPPCPSDRDHKAKGVSGAELPLYLRVKMRLRWQILTGAYAEGDCLPPASELAKKHGVNKNTILRALRMLRAEGVIDFGRGRGPIVLRSTQQASLADVSEQLQQVVRLADVSGISRAAIVSAVQRIPRATSLRDGVAGRGNPALRTPAHYVPVGREGHSAA
ncbi:GntR family transcriptional regulator [Streptomyces sioyaensis]|uniref:GntR family transcriptional regulator n=1 Tax=Streptomyces sioyaensis TaxID=67364 RepID=UPI00365BC22A